MRTGVTDKVKLNLVEKALPMSLQQIVRRSAPTTLPGEPAFVDTWELALQRLSKEMTKLEQTTAIAEAVKRTQKSRTQDSPFKLGQQDQEFPRGLRGGFKKFRGLRLSSKPFKPNRFSWGRGAQNNHNSRGGAKPQGRDNRADGKADAKDAKTNNDKPVTCFSCGEQGHYANRCPKKKDTTVTSSATSSSTSSFNPRKGRGRGRPAAQRG